jgi:hypothetical protein
MVHGLLMELDDHNCQPVAEAIGHRGPHRLQHLLSRAITRDELAGTGSPAGRLCTMGCSRRGELNGARQ